MIAREIRHAPCTSDAQGRIQRLTTHRLTIMQHVHDGQCGLCSHFGETHSATEKIVQIRTTKEAPETLVDECGHPRHASLHLVVTPISGCNGFEAARAM